MGSDSIMYQLSLKLSAKPKVWFWQFLTVFKTILFTLHQWEWSEHKKFLSLTYLLGEKIPTLASRCRRTLRGEGHSAASWGIGGFGYSCRLRGPKSVRSGNGLPLLALCHLVSLPVSTPLRIVNRCCKWRYINVDIYNLFNLSLTYIFNYWLIYLFTYSQIPAFRKL